MLNIYIFIGVLLLLSILFIVWAVKQLISPQIKMQKAVSGERTKFIIDTSKYGNEYYKNKIENWLKYNKFSKYNKKKNGRYLTYHKEELIYKFGFNYYEEEKSIIIEAWIVYLGKEQPLKETLYTYEKGEFNILSAATGGPLKENGDVPIIAGKQSKDTYLEFLKSIMDLPDQIGEHNNVKLKDEIDYTKIEDQKKATIYNLKFIFIVIAIATFISFLILLPGKMSQPKISEQDINDALNLIRTRYPSFELIDYDTSIKKINYSKEEAYAIYYIFNGKMNTFNDKKEEVTIYMSNSGYSNLSLIEGEDNWAGNILINGIKYDFDKVRID